MPSFTLEVQGETNPLTSREVLAILSRAYGGGQQNLQVASEQLTNWEKQQGYYSILQDIYADLSIDQNLRFQAIIQLKNGIDKHWRKTSPNAIKKEEKLLIRSRAIECGIREPLPALGLQNALMVAKIARYEFPHDWPDVITILISELRTYNKFSENLTHLSNSMNISLQVIKELASGRLQRTKKSLEQVSLELLQVVGSIYVSLFQRWVRQLNPPYTLEGLEAHMKYSHMALKIIRCLLVSGFEHPHREKDIQQFWVILQQQQASLWNLWPAIQQLCDLNSNESGLILKHFFQLSKIDLELARTHPASFVLLPNSMGVLSRSWNTINLFGTRLRDSTTQSDWKVKNGGDVDDDASPLEKLALRALLILRACIKMVFNPVQTFKYQHPQDKEDRKSATEKIRSEVLSDDFVIGLMEVLVTQYFVLRDSDLRDWETEPDEWEKREEEIADAWEFSVRSCSEKLFLDLVINFKTLLVPRLLQVFKQYADVANSDVLIKESLYSAIGIAAACLEDKLDFNSFLCTTLVQEIQIRQPGYNLIRRRAAILLGQWVPIKPDTLDRKTVYQIFAHLLNKQDPLNDAVVQVTAGRQLRPVLEPFEFKFEDFAPYATHIFQCLMSLIMDTELSETKLALLETVRVAVTKLEDQIEPYADAIISMLPPLWADSGEEHLMKQAILTMITAIITSLGRNSLKYHSAFLPLIRDSVQPGSETMVYLLEDALDLWAAVLQQSPSANPTPSAELLSLVQSLLPLLDTGAESLRQILELAESHILLSPMYIISESNVLLPLLSALGALLDAFNSPRPRDAALGPHVVEVLIQSIASLDSSVQDEALQMLLSAMVSTGYLAKLLDLLQQARTYHQDPRPSRQPPGVIGIGETSLFSILGRLMLHNPHLTLSALSPNSDTYTWLLAEWLTHFDSIGDTQKKKLQCLGITHFLVLSQPPPTFVLEQLQSLITIWTDVLTELNQENDSGDYLWQGPDPVDEPWVGETSEDTRKRRLGLLDPVFEVNAREHVGGILRAAIASVGAEVFHQQWLSRVDGVVTEQFVELDLL
jgi:hypothetical protein